MSPTSSSEMGKVNRTLPKYAFQLKDAPGSSAGIGGELAEVQVYVTEQVAKEAQLKAAELAKNKEDAAKGKEKDKDAAKSAKRVSSGCTRGIPESL